MARVYECPSELCCWTFLECQRGTNNFTHWIIALFHKCRIINYREDSLSLVPKTRVEILLSGCHQIRRRLEGVKNIKDVFHASNRGPQIPTLGTRGFFSRASRVRLAGRFVGRRPKTRAAKVTFKDLTETGNHAWKASGTRLSNPPSSNEHWR